MRLFRLRRFAFAFWLGLLALTVSGVAQNQLSTNVLVAGLTDAGGHDHHHAAHGHQSGGHYMPDGSYMPGPMAGAAHDVPDQDGHTHKGHSDCTVCSVVAAMASLSTSVIAILPAPQVNAAAAGWIATQSHVAVSSPAFYSSRAPPHPALRLAA